MLHGRTRERSVINRLLADARAGRGDALVVRGEAGVGKTALLDYAATAAIASGDGGPGCATSGCSAPGEVVPPGMAGIRVIRGAGVQSEAALPFAGLHLLLGPALTRRAALPQSQRYALDAAFGAPNAGSHDRFLVGLAVLSLLAEVAENGPLLCLVDDAQWLDLASAEALVFAARRLGASEIAIIFAARDDDGPFTAPGLPELRLGGLDAAASAALLAERGGTELHPEARARILAEAGGNPLGLIELVAAHRSVSPAAAWLGPGGLALTDRLQQAFTGRTRRLPESTQTLLLAAAAEDSGDLGVILAAARALGAEAADLCAAEQAGLIHIVDRTVTFRHPLLRAAVYQGARVSRRLAVHQALACELRRRGDADRRAWHLATVATGPDEEVAAELERTATTAMARGGHLAAMAAYEQAVQLTADPATQAQRLALAAKAAAEIGEFDRARSLAVRAASQTSDSDLQAKLAGLRALADSAQGRLPAAHRLLVQAAAQFGGRDPLVAMRMLIDAVHIAWFLGDRELIADTADRLKLAGESVAQPCVPLVQLMLWPAAQADERPRDSLPPLADTVARARRRRAGDRDGLAVIATVCLVTGRNADARELLGELAADARAQGRIGPLPALLVSLAQALVLDGRHGDALASVGEALQIAHDTRQVRWIIEANAIMAYLAAIEGDQQRCRRLVDAALAGPTTHAASPATPWVPWALGLLELGRGRLDTALVQLEMIFRAPMRYHGSALQSIPDLVEAAVRLGQPQRAAEPLTRFSQWARRAGTPSIDALVERCHALLEVDGDAERHYLAALTLPEQSFEQARTRLLYGAWLRRARRKAHARTQLRAALDYFERNNATPWAEQARAELSATGATTLQQSRTGLLHLTPQELQVVRRAAQGLSNREIAAQLFLSPRTVAYHLYKAYPKLAVTSRGQLDPNTLAP